MKNFLIYNISLVFLMLIGMNVNAPQDTLRFMSKDLLEIGSVAPDFQLYSADNELIKLSDFQGKVVLLDFWYVGCKPCIKAYKDIDSLKQVLGKNQFEILGMNPINRKAQINRYIQKYQYNERTVLCSEEIEQAYKIRAYPCVYLIDKQGKIVFASAGYYQDFASLLAEAIRKANEK